MAILDYSKPLIDLSASLGLNSGSSTTTPSGQDPTGNTEVPTGAPSTPSTITGGGTGGNTTSSGQTSGQTTGNTSGETTGPKVVYNQTIVVVEPEMPRGLLKSGGPKPPPEKRPY